MIYYGLEYQHRYDMDQVYGGFELLFQYQRSFDASNLARGLFGTNVLNFAGSAVAAPATNALLADNFGLSRDFVGSIALKPVIQSFNLGFDWFIGLDEWARGLYLQIDLNFEAQKRELQSNCSCVTSTTYGNVAFPAGYMSVSTSPVAPITDIPTALGLQGTFGDKKTAGTFGRFDFCDRTESGIAGLSANLGYDFVRCDNYFLGVFFRVVAPTGSKVHPEYVFSPIVGNGKGWEVGAGISSRWEMWNNNDCQKLTAMLDGYVVSILKHNSLRTFDLATTNTACRVNYICNTNSCNTSCNNSCNTGCSVDSCNTGCSVSSCNTGCSVDSCNTGCSVSSCNTTNGCNISPCSTSCNNECAASASGCNYCAAANSLSRYSLLKQFNVAGDVYTYAGNLITAADYTTRSVDVRTPCKGDATVRIVYTHGGFDFGFGYNVFGMTREKISAVGAASSCLFTTTATAFGLKGCQCVGYDLYPYNTDTDLITGAPTVLALESTASNATAYQNGCGTCGTIDNSTPITVTGGTYATACTSNGGVIYPVDTPIAGLTPAVYSDPVVVLSGTVNDLDLCSGTAPRQYSSKGFISLDYTWEDCDWAPFIGFIAEVEGGARNLDLAQWGVVIRGGVSY